MAKKVVSKEDLLQKVDALQKAVLELKEVDVDLDLLEERFYRLFKGHYKQWCWYHKRVKDWEGKVTDDAEASYLSSINRSCSEEFDVWNFIVEAYIFIKTGKLYNDVEYRYSGVETFVEVEEWVDLLQEAKDRWTDRIYKEDSKNEEE